MEGMEAPLEPGFGPEESIPDATERGSLASLGLAPAEPTAALPVAEAEPAPFRGEEETLAMRPQSEATREPQARKPSHLRLVASTATADLPAADRRQSFSGRAFGPNAPDEPLPAPSRIQPIAEDSVNLMREESVMALAEAARAGRGARFVARARDWGDSIVQAPRIASAVVAGASRSAWRRFLRMPLKNQLMVAAAPYLGIAVVVGGFLLLRAEPEAATVPIAPIATQTEPTPKTVAAPVVPVAPIVPAAAPVAPAPAAPVAPAPAAPVAAAPVVAAESVAPATKTVEKPVGLQAEAHTLAARTTLWVRPEAGADKATVLRPGSVVALYRAFPAPEGWVLVQSQKGSVGFVSEAVLSGQAEAPPKATRRSKRKLPPLPL